MSGEIKVLRESDLTTILEREERAMSEHIDDPIQRKFESWHAKWRQESLEHYLALGWSMGLWNGDNLTGYFLAQPFLFFRGLTQTLWVEHLSFDAPEGANDLVEVACRLSREKRLQCVIFHDGKKFEPQLEAWHPEILTGALYMVKTTKF